MNGGRLWLTAAVVLYAGAVLQGAVAPRIAIMGASPDFMLIAVSCLGLLAGRACGAVTGLIAGVVSGSLASASLAAFAASRAIAGFAGGWSTRVLQPTLWVTAPVVVFAATILGELVFLLISPQTDLGLWVRLTLLRGAYDSVLSVPLYVVLLRSASSAKERATR
jgi:hypothetical protein